MLAVLGALSLGTADADDRKQLPPESRVFASPSGAYVLEVRGSPGWREPQAQAELSAVGAAGRSRVWSAVLPHRYGPGTAFVSDAGRVVLVDEWLKSPSPFALMLFDAKGGVLAQHSMADIAAVADLPTASLVTLARVGPWMSAAPAMAAGRPVLLLEAGGVGLEFELGSGQLTRTIGSPR